MIYIVMGVSGSGKSTMGQELAATTGLRFEDADDYHPQANIDKMKNGIPLNDHDRYEWLICLAEKIESWYASGGVILACSALKESYRDILKTKCRDHVEFIYLKGSYELIKSRLESRQNHFMGSNLLKSQFETLEEPVDAITVSLKETPEKMLGGILRQMTCNLSESEQV